MCLRRSIPLVGGQYEIYSIRPVSYTHLSRIYTIARIDTHTSEITYIEDWVEDITQRKSEDIGFYIQRGCVQNEIMYYPAPAAQDVYKRQICSCISELRRSSAGPILIIRFHMALYGRLSLTVISAVSLLPVCSSIFSAPFSLKYRSSSVSYTHLDVYKRQTPPVPVWPTQ